MTRSLRLSAVIALATVLAACSGGSGGSLTPQSESPSTSQSPAMPSHAGRGVVVSYTYHIMPLRTAKRPIADAKLQYPMDLTNYKGPVMKSLSTHNIYVNCPAQNESCWGDPETFQTNLAGSTFAALLTQYTKSPASGYVFTNSTSTTYPSYPRSPFYQTDLFNIIHSVAVNASGQVGYTNIYHVFLMPHQDTCFDFSTQCYSPDHRSTWAFCAYHGAIKYSDIGTVIYSIEPYQDVPGCSTPKSSGASEQTNSTISTLAHETFEAITDPGPKLAWINFGYGEIGDECEFLVTSVKLGSLTYNTQPMYSNKYHACATGP